MLREVDRLVAWRLLPGTLIAKEQLYIRQLIRQGLRTSPNNHFRKPKSHIARGRTSYWRTFHRRAPHGRTLMSVPRMGVL